MATPTEETVTIINPPTPQNPILSINMSSITKLTSSNYITWSLQVSLFLQGHDLHEYISDSSIIPSPTIEDNGVLAQNPLHLQWQRQDKLIFAALLGTLTTPLQPLISCATSSAEAWQILATTYGRPTRGHIKQLRDQLKKSVKGSKTVDEYVQHMKIKADQLSLLGKPIDHEELIEFILDGLDDDYKAQLLPENPIRRSRF